MQTVNLRLSLCVVLLLKEEAPQLDTSQDDLKPLQLINLSLQYDYPVKTRFFTVSYIA